ncbi:MAG TPA: WGxxGxxG family protein [Flavitalea sp.]|nr:WGxxGxxG family protein [Flavitalea sp.]
MKKMYMVGIAAMTVLFPAQQSFAQNTDRSQTEMNRTDDDDDDNTGKWGLLGLLGLIGLAGLKRKDDDRTVRTTPRTDR